MYNVFIYIYICYHVPIFYCAYKAIYSSLFFIFLKSQKKKKKKKKEDFCNFKVNYSFPIGQTFFNESKIKSLKKKKKVKLMKILKNL